MQGVHAWIGPFEIIVFATHCRGIFVPASVVVCIVFYSPSDGGLKVFQVSATEYSAYSVHVVLLFRYNLMFVSPQKHSKHLGIKSAMGLLMTPQVQAVYSFFV